MKIKFGIVIMILFFISCKDKVYFAQLEERDEITYKMGEDKPFTGIAETYFTDVPTQLKCKAIYNNGKLNGTWITYHKSGKKEIETNYVDEYESGPRKEWDEYGNLLLEGNNGIIIKKNGNKESRKVGQWNSYYKDGKISVINKYDDNGMLLEQNSFYSNGKKADHILYDDKGNFHQNIIEQYEYSEDGETTLAKKNNYNDGVFVSEYRYHPNNLKLWYTIEVDSTNQLRRIISRYDDDKLSGRFIIELDITSYHKDNWNIIDIWPNENYNKLDEEVFSTSGYKIGSR